MAASLRRLTQPSPRGEKWLARLPDPFQGKLVTPCRQGGSDARRFLGLPPEQPSDDGAEKVTRRATAEAIGNRRHPLVRLSSIFRDVSSAREGGWNTDIPRLHLRQNVEDADEKLIERIAKANAPFWQHVREALLAQASD
jgi:hypothetical protein